MAIKQRRLYAIGRMSMTRPGWVAFGLAILALLVAGVLLILGHQQTAALVTMVGAAINIVGHLSTSGAKQDRAVQEGRFK